jgi:protocatechuate 3,4-dioxygenase beta subunit
MHIDRRDALRLIGAASAGLVLVACGGDEKDAADSTTTSAAAAGITTTSASGDSTAKSPTETGGPYPGDGTNGPNVLDDEAIVRSDITKSFGQFSGTATGVPLTINLKVVKAGSGAAYSGAAVYLWHCDAQGRYTLYSAGATDQNYCRGVQAADSAGALTFKTVFPAAYAGRWPHFHYEVFPSLTAAGSAANRLLTSQIALPKQPCDAVYADSSAYPNSARNLQDTSLQSDMVFQDSYQSEMGAVTGSPSSGYTMTYTIVV